MESPGRAAIALIQLPPPEAVRLDDGALIKAFGDPRLLGAELPLYVVIGADGKVAHYKSGYYEVDRLEGLKQLNAVLGEQLKAKR